MKSHYKNCVYSTSRTRRRFASLDTLRSPVDGVSAAAGLYQFLLHARLYAGL